MYLPSNSEKVTLFTLLCTSFFTIAFLLADIREQDWDNFFLFQENISNAKHRWFLS